MRVATQTAVMALDMLPIRLGPFASVLWAWAKTVLPPRRTTRIAVCGSFAARQVSKAAAYAGSCPGAADWAGRAMVVARFAAWALASPLSQSAAAIAIAQLPSVCEQKVDMGHSLEIGIL